MDISTIRNHTHELDFIGLDTDLTIEALRYLAERLTDTTEAPAETEEAALLMLRYREAATLSNMLLHYVSELEKQNEKSRSELDKLIKAVADNTTQN